MLVTPLTMAWTVVFCSSLLFLARNGHAQQISCGDSAFICIGRSSFQFCQPDSEGRLFTSGEVLSCSQVAGDVCNPDSEKLGLASPCEVTPPPCTEPGQFPLTGEQADCGRYIICVYNGKSFSQFTGYCKFGFEFSATLKSCTIPEAAGCSIPITTTITTLPTTISPPPSAFMCPNIGKYPDPRSCRHYYICTNTSSGFLLPIRASCRLNLSFNVFTQNCTIPEQPGCLDVTTQIPPTQPTPIPTPEFLCTMNGRFPEPSNCRQYHTCLMNGPSTFMHILSQCFEPLRFDQEAMQCLMGADCGTRPLL